MTYSCPVCGYDKLRQPAEDHTICRCCGIQFGYDDSVVSHSQLRQEWIEKGGKWWSRRESPPPGWTAEGQLRAAGLSYARPTQAA